jgi:hypothetical protein
MDEPELLYLFEIIPIFLPVIFIEQLLIFPMSPLESSNLRELPTCLI